MSHQSAPPGKTRTRQHIIADLAVNHMERQVLLSGHTVQRVDYDYGYDLTITTYDDKGQVEGGLIMVQVKATDQLPLLKDGKTISWPVNRRDLKLWLSEQYPVILVVYDGLKNIAYWLDIQADVAARSTAELFGARHTMNRRIPVANRVNQRSIQAMVRHKRCVHECMQEMRQRLD